jgi:hypothetical protein
VLGSLGGFVLSESASANGAILGCPAPKACIWRDNNFHTQNVTVWSKSFTSWDGDFSGDNYDTTPFPANDSASSAWQSSAVASVEFWIHAGCNGPSATFLAINGSGAGILAVQDQLSSGARPGFVGGAFC